MKKHERALLEEKQKESEKKPSQSPAEDPAIQKQPAKEVPTDRTQVDQPREFNQFNKGEFK